MTTFHCDRRGLDKPRQTDVGTGYAKFEGKTICYACCVIVDAEWMREKGKIALYLSGKPGEFKITNWPGTLAIWPFKARVGNHNIAGKRYDVWFNFEGKSWHGVTYGDNTQICHCKQTKG